jgi:subfamily B ATP-binding cassette protein MsbA
LRDGKLLTTHPAWGLTRVGTQHDIEQQPADEFDRPSQTVRDRRSNLALLARMLSFAKPYLAVIAISIALTLVFSAGRYVRAYLMKPLLDDVLLPAHATRVAETDDVAGLETWPKIDIGFSTPNRQPTADPSAMTPSANSPSHILDQLRFILVVALAIAVVMPGVLYARLYLLAHTLGRISIDIKNTLAAKLLRLPLAFHRTNHSGETLNRALNDSNASEAALKLVFGDFLQAGTMVIGGAATLWFISWQLTLVSLISAPPVIGTVAWFARRIRKSARRRQEQLGEVTQRLVEILAGIKVIKAFGGEQLEEEAFRREATKLFRRDMKVVKNRVLSRSVVEFVTGLSGIGMLGLGAWLVLRGMWGITPGAVAAFATVLATTYRPLKTLSRSWAKLSEALASAERYFEILDMGTEVPDRVDAIAIDGVHQSIRFRSVGFRYEEKSVLDGIDLEVNAGEVIAIVGRSGEGKSTLVDLLLRFHEPSVGAIEIDGRDLRNITRKSLMAQIAIVSQEPFLFDTTIGENIRYGRPNASDEEVEQAAAIARVNEFSMQLPDGFQTQVGEFGLRLSGGQRQRITIARALLKNPAILVFDEATSALDAKTEQTVQDAIDALRGDRTLFIVAHRLSTIRRADRILVMESGTITQQGTHDELMAQPGQYRDLSGLQSEGLSPLQK